ncbi:unnamed protein product, partial [Prorocentrum cordatum]
MWTFRGPLPGASAPEPAVLQAARLAASPAAGAVEELDRKHLLALNLRCLPAAHGLSPRAYYLPPPQGAGGDCGEGAAFRSDFALSEAASLLLRASACLSSSSGGGAAKQRDPRQEAVEVACAVCRSYLESDGGEWMNEGYWQALQSEAAGDGALPLAVCEEAQRLLGLLQERLPFLQLGLLVRNVWILKPVAGAHGQGIAFITALDADGTPVQTERTEKVSFQRRGLGDHLGFVVQKYIERPHLLSADILGDDGDASGETGHAQPRGQSQHRPRPMHKYSLRFWVDALWSSHRPEAWLYETGYVQLANSPYTEQLTEPTAHVSNLAQLAAPARSSGLPRTPAELSLEAYRRDRLRRQHPGADTYAERLLPQLRQVAAGALAAVRPGDPPEDQEEKAPGRRPWRRLGLDFAVSEDLRVWLIEVNKKPGMGCAKGRRGDATHRLVSRFFEAERALRCQRGGAQEECEAGSRAFGFRRLDVATWGQPAASTGRDADCMGGGETPPSSAQSLLADGLADHPLHGSRASLALGHARQVDVPPGSVKELHLKHLLALNLRKLRGEELRFVPRSYVLQPGNFFEEEFADFAFDFKISQALAVVKYIAEASETAPWSPPDPAASGRGARRQPEGLWGRDLLEVSWQPGPDPSLPVDGQCVAAALAVARRVVAAGQARRAVAVDEAEWALIRSFSPQARLAEPLCDSEAAGALLRALPAELQVSLLCGNLWLLKPSCGQFGRGILLLDRLPEAPTQLLQWASAVGRGGLKAASNDKEGCILQKLVERPHLLDPEVLGAAARPGPRRAPALFKYGMRIWVLASMSQCPRVWLYREGHVSLALQAFTAAPDALSHITNLRVVDGNPGEHTQRLWQLSDFAAHLGEHEGAGTYEARLLPQVRGVVRELFRGLAAAPSALAPEASESGRRLRRFGIDLLVDEALAVWLIEVNILKDGYALQYAPRGSSGEAKRLLVKRLVEDEALLRVAARTGRGDIPETFEQLLPALDPGGAEGRPGPDPPACLTCADVGSAVSPP